MSNAPVFIGVAPNGARRTRADHPALPITPQDLAETATACASAGAAMIHLHVRDEALAHTLGAGRYRAAIDAIRDAAGASIVVQITTEAVGRYAPPAQMQAVRDIGPAFASCALRELCRNEADEPAYGAFLTECMEKRIAIQHILYEPAELIRFLVLRDRAIIPGARPSVLLVCGRDDTGRSVTERLAGFDAAGLDQAGADIMVCGFAAMEHAVTDAAAARGWSVRVGFENNLVRRDGVVYRDNADSVAAAAAILKNAGRSLMDAATLTARLRKNNGWA